MGGVEPQVIGECRLCDRVEVPIYLDRISGAHELCFKVRHIEAFKPG